MGALSRSWHWQRVCSDLQTSFDLFEEKVREAGWCVSIHHNTIDVWDPNSLSTMGVLHIEQVRDITNAEIDIWITQARLDHLFSDSTTT